MIREFTIDTEIGKRRLIIQETNLGFIHLMESLDNEKQIISLTRNELMSIYLLLTDNQAV